MTSTDYNPTYNWMVWIIYPDGETLAYDHEEFSSYDEATVRKNEIISKEQAFFYDRTYIVDYA